MALLTNGVDTAAESAFYRRSAQNNGSINGRRGRGGGPLSRGSGTVAVRAPPIRGNADRLLAAGTHGRQSAHAAGRVRGYAGFGPAAFRQLMTDVVHPLK
ncbi:hypothetical protein KBP30_10460 [Streptomyces sp. Go40/10]|uniref:hypothetical protein n=1 Tax=Streptomyces sp. Go40/10 TaxID=2825844 RepID=UPI001E4089EE|nr:hypothetical protein [Streptomyces sp. Go40/10]UFR01580.1 hypothetical protein KBP30_10460 [Streptomyces sp. Go40/10]